MDILIVDDNPVVIMATKMILNNISKDISITTASDAEEAMNIIPEIPFDVIITDLCMPGKNGDQLAQAIRNSGKAENTKIFICSARSPEAQEQKLIDEHCNGFIEKPLTKESLTALLTEHFYSGDKQLG